MKKEGFLQNSNFYLKLIHFWLNCLKTSWLCCLSKVSPCTLVFFLCMHFTMCSPPFFFLNVLSWKKGFSCKTPMFNSTGRRPASLCHGLLSVRLSVRVLTFSLNIFFSETTYWILMKFYRNVPAMVLFRIC